LQIIFFSLGFVCLVLYAISNPQTTIAKTQEIYRKVRYFVETKIATNGQFSRFASKQKGASKKGKSKQKIQKKKIYKEKKERCFGHGKSAITVQFVQQLGHKS